MKTTHDEIAKKIHFNAKKILETKNIETTLKNKGELYYTGSYALDLMTWNDIDMQLILKDGIDPIGALGDFFKLISQDPDFLEAQMIHFKGDYKPKMPRGVYIGIKLDSPVYGGIWKLDLWVLAKEDFENNRALIEKLKIKLDDTTRELILDLKREMMVGSDRVPQMGSHFLYQAVLLDGLKERQKIYEYLSKKGITLNQKKIK